MTIIYAKEKDRTKWNNFVKNSKNSTFFHLFEWGEVLEKNFNSYHKMHLMVKKDSQIIGVFPLFSVKIGIFNLLSSMPLSYPAGTYGGPLLENEHILEKLFRKTDEIGKESGSLELNITIPPNAIQQSSGFNNFQMDKHLTHILYLSQPLDELFKSYKKETRSAIRQSIRNGLTFQEANDGNISEYFEMYQKTMTKLKSNVTYPSKFFEDILHHICYIGYGKIFFAEYNHKQIAGVILFNFKDTVYLFNNVSNEDYLKLRPNNFLLHNSIKFAVDNGFKYFDFGPSSTKSLAQFKKSWGATEVEFISYLKVYSPYKKKIWDKIFNLYLSHKDKIPAFLFEKFYFGSRDVN